MSNGCNGRFLENNDTKEKTVDYGIIPELMGRLPICIKLHDLTEKELVRVLTEPKNAITKQYQHMMESDHIHLIFGKFFFFS